MSDFSALPASPSVPTGAVASWTAQLADTLASDAKFSQLSGGVHAVVRVADLQEAVALLRAYAHALPITAPVGTSASECTQ